MEHVSDLSQRGRQLLLTGQGIMVERRRDAREDFYISSRVWEDARILARAARIGLLKKEVQEYEGPTLYSFIYSLPA